MAEAVLGRPQIENLAEQEISGRIKELLRVHKAERQHLDTLHEYYRGEQRHPSVPKSVPDEVKQFVKMSRVNVLKLIVSSVAQALYIDGYRSPDDAAEAPVWSVWQANGLDARQIGIHRGALTYGVAYASSLPGRPAPVIRGHSPRRMLAIYGEDDEWPVWALQVEPWGGLLSDGSHARAGWFVRLFDEQRTYTTRVDQIDEIDKADVQIQSVDVHNAGVTPVVRFRNLVDLDGDIDGDIQELIPVQDQIDHTTFALLVAQHFGAFRQRYIIGWVADSEKKKLQASAARVWTFEDDPETMKIGEFEQTDLKGFLESREASLRHAATISQTPAHELIGQMVNLSADALVAAEASQRRKVTERQVSFGESWEQLLRLASEMAGLDASVEAQVRWRDTESRALAQTVDALGKATTMLGVPPQELWDRIPGVTQQDVERWKQAFREQDALAGLTAMLERQAAPSDE